jgi:triosephosphate isomerase
MVHQHLIANFKMNLLDSEIRNYVSQLSQSDVLKKPRPVHLKIGLAPSSPYLLSCQAQLSETSSSLDLYAQNISQATQGAHTGEVSAQQMHDCGAQGSIIGHSERRSLHHETPEILVQKMEALKQFKMRAIYCLGEETTDLPDQNLDQLLKEQVGILKDFPSTHLIIAYEPKWAIGTGREAEPQHIRRVSTYIRQHLVNLYGQEQALNIPLLYGGSVNAKNLSPILDLENINGALVGSASLDLDHFIALIELFIDANL